MPEQDTRRSRRLLRAVLILTAGVLLVVPTVALASHQWPDVPDEQPFHDDIDWLTGTGITRGFADGTFRPDAPVTRGQMAAFMHRLSGNADVDPSVNAATVNELEHFAAAVVSVDGDLVHAAGATSEAQRSEEGRYDVFFEEPFAMLGGTQAFFPQVSAQRAELATPASCTWTLLGDSFDMLTVECWDVADGEPVDSRFVLTLWRAEP